MTTEKEELCRVTSYLSKEEKTALKELLAPTNITVSKFIRKLIKQEIANGR